MPPTIARVDEARLHYKLDTGWSVTLHICGELRRTIGPDDDGSHVEFDFDVANLSNYLYDLAVEDWHINYRSYPSTTCPSTTAPNKPIHSLLVSRFLHTKKPALALDRGGRGLSGQHFRTAAQAHAGRRLSRCSGPRSFSPTRNTSSDDIMATETPGASQLHKVSSYQIATRPSQWSKV
jgi:hypothetical protein